MGAKSRGSRTTGCVRRWLESVGLFFRVCCHDAFEEKNPPPGAFKFRKLERRFQPEKVLTPSEVSVRACLF